MLHALFRKPKASTTMTEQMPATPVTERNGDSRSAYEFKDNQAVASALELHGTASWKKTIIAFIRMATASVENAWGDMVDEALKVFDDFKYGNAPAPFRSYQRYVVDQMVYLADKTSLPQRERLAALFAAVMLSATHPRLQAQVRNSIEALETALSLRLPGTCEALARRVVAAQEVANEALRIEFVAALESFGTISATSEEARRPLSETLKRVLDFFQTSPGVFHHEKAIKKVAGGKTTGRKRVSQLWAVRPELRDHLKAAKYWFEDGDEEARDKVGYLYKHIIESPAEDDPAVTPEVPF